MNNTSTIEPPVTDTQEAAGHGKHRGPVSGQDNPVTGQDYEATPHGRHRKPSGRPDTSA
ncbi:hypothetical protein [Streptomyces sp. SD15]